MLLEALRGQGAHGATAYDLHRLTGLPYKEAARGLLDLLMDGRASPTSMRREVPEGPHMVFVAEAVYGEG